jgi:hypothetical protein
LNSASRISGQQVEHSLRADPVSGMPQLRHVSIAAADGFGEPLLRRVPLIRECMMFARVSRVLNSILPGLLRARSCAKPSVIGAIAVGCFGPVIPARCGDGVRPTLVGVLPRSA